MVAFDVDLPSYHGPLDLLLYLIRREELDIESIELARITKQYAQFVNILAELDLENIKRTQEVPQRPKSKAYSFRRNNKLACDYLIYRSHKLLYRRIVEHVLPIKSLSTTTDLPDRICICLHVSKIHRWPLTRP